MARRYIDGRLPNQTSMSEPGLFNFWHMWNHLPQSVRSAASVCQFKSKLQARFQKMSQSAQFLC